MSVQYFENSTFGVIVSGSSQVGWGQYFACDRRVGSGRYSGHKKWSRGRLSHNYYKSARYLSCLV